MPVPTAVVTADATLFRGPVDFLIALGRDGELGVLPNHAPLMTALKPGPLVLRQGRVESCFFLTGGFLEVLPERVTILADEGEPADAIDLAEAQRARKAAEDRLGAQEAGSAEAAQLERALLYATQRVKAAERARTLRRG